MIIIKTPQPPVDERLVLVPPESCTPVFDDGKPAGLSIRAQGARDATPADLARAGYGLVHREQFGLGAVRDELSSMTARVETLRDALETERGLTEKQRARAEKAERALRCQCSEPGDSPCRVHDEERADAAERNLSAALERAEKAEAHIKGLHDAEQATRRILDAVLGEPTADAATRLHNDWVDTRDRAEKAEREREEARRLHSEAEAQIECRNELRAKLAQAERERADLRAELARLTAPVSQPAKDRATDEELAALARVEWNGHDGSLTLTALLRAVALAVAARVRGERCLVAQAVGMGADVHIESYSTGYSLSVSRPREATDGGEFFEGAMVERDADDIPPADVPATLARLLGEVAR